MNHRITMVSDTPSFIRDMIPVQFESTTMSDRVMRVIIPAEDTTVIEFVYDRHLLAWIMFCVANGIDFSYHFMNEA